MSKIPFSKFVVVFAVIIVGLLIVSGFVFYKFEKERIVKAEYLKLKAIADLKEDQIVNWKTDRLADAMHFSKSPLYSKAIAKYLLLPDSVIRDEIISRNNMIKDLRGFESVFIMPPDKTPKFTSDSVKPNLDKVLMAYADSSKANKRIYLTDFYISATGEINMAIVAPILFINEVVALQIFIINPETYLFPVLQSWPTPSATSEILILRKEGSNIRFLNKPRLSKNKAYESVFSMADNEIASVKAVSGFEGIIEGKDYRNIQVLADVRHISDSPWYMITKVDKKEIFSELHFRTATLSFIVFILIVLLGLVIALNYQIKKRVIEKELLETTKRLKDIIEFLPDAILAIDLEGKVIAWNRAIQDMTGVPKEEMLGKGNYTYSVPFFGKRHPILVDFVLKEYPEFFKHYESFRKEGDTLIAESNICVIDGRRLHLYGKATPLYGSNGEITGAIELIRDITDLKKHEELLKKKDLIFESLLEHSPIYVFFKDKEIRAVHLSRNYEQMLGMPLHKIIGKNMFDLFPSQLAQNMIEDDKKILFEGKLVQVDEELNGRYYTTIKFPIAQDGQEPMLAGFTIDITDRKAAEKELIIARDRAENSEKLKDAFLQNMSHEIRTPLNAIVGFSELLGSANLDREKMKNYISIIITSSEQLLSIVSDILTVSRIQTGQEVVNEKSANINTILDNLYHVFELKGPEKNNDFIKYAALPDNEAEIYTDQTKLYQIITNLLANAFKFTSNGKIEFGYELKEDTLEFFVIDTGIGIKPDKQKIIFDRFAQADITISKRYGGTGLGLSICKAYTELLGGTIWVKSITDGGSSFYFTIPYRKSVKNECAKTQNLHSNGNLQKTILVVDDEKFNFELIVEILERKKYTFLWAKNGQEAIDIYKLNPGIDIILMDIKMPEMDGQTAMIEIKKLNPDIPIIAQTAYALDDEKELFMKSGFNDYVTKPINSEEFMVKIQKYLL